MKNRDKWLYLIVGAMGLGLILWAMFSPNARAQEQQQQQSRTWSMLVVSEDAACLVASGDGWSSDLHKLGRKV